MKITLSTHQSENDVTGSCHIVEISGKQYMIDCGMFQPDTDNKRNNAFECDIDKLQGVLLTHGHLDHCGLLPKLVKNGYSKKIYSTPATRDLASVVLMDSAKIQKSEKEPCYSEEEVLETLDHFRCHFYHKHKKIDDNVTATFYDAGHILGSAMIDFEARSSSFFSKIFHKKPVHILFTGDLGREMNPITCPPAIDMPAPDYIVLESTYGDRLHKSIEHSFLDLMDCINETIGRGGKVIIPSFAVERAQEIIYYLKLLMQEDKIPKVPIYVDSPMAANATGVFSIHPECLNDEINERFISKGKSPFSTGTLQYITDTSKSKTIARSKKPCIVIAASGMCDNGRIVSHLKYSVESKLNTIVIVGYMAEGTLGRRILDKEDKLLIDGKWCCLRADVKVCEAFSAHADYEEILKWLSKIDTSNVKKIFLVHGSKESRANLKRLLEEKGFKTESLSEAELKI